MTIYHRNILGQVERMTDALGQTETFKYSQRGELIEKVDKDNFLTKYRYTKLGDVNHIHYADGKEVAMSYNALRQLTEIKDWLGTTSITLDPLGRATKVQDHNDNVIEYSYGKLGERRSITYPDGKQISYNYDENLRLTSINDGENPVHYHYDNLGRLTEKSFANGAKTAYNFNALGQLGQLTHFKQDEILDKYVYGYDNLGNKTSIEKQRYGLEVDNGAYTYSYDPLNRLTEVTKDGQALRNYSYDNFGNRTSLIENNVETNYTYNSLNQLISSSDGKSFSYDKRGNLTSILKNGSIINEYEFNPMNRLGKAINHETHLSSIYKYNGLSRRVGSQVGDLDLNPMKQVEFTLDMTCSFHNLLQKTEDGVTNSYTYDFGLLSADGNPYMLDDLGSPVRFGDETYSYDEFGNSLHNESAQPFSFTGYQHDPVSGTLFAQARQYSPEQGRFMSQDIHWNPQNMIYGDNQAYSQVPDPLRGLAPDSLAIGQSSNLYGYTLNNPVNNVDLNGEALLTVTAGLIWGTVKAVSGAFGAGFIVGGGVNILEQGINNGWNDISVSEVFISGVSSGTQSALVASGWKAPVIIGTNMIIAGGEHLLTNDEVTLRGLATDMVWSGGSSWLGVRPSGHWLTTTIGSNGVPDGFMREGLRGGAQQVLPNTFLRELGGALKDDTIQFSVENGPKFWNWLRCVLDFESRECDF